METGTHAIEVYTNVLMFPELAIAPISGRVPAAAPAATIMPSKGPCSACSCSTEATVSM